jgi:hypothetical protein
VNHVPVLLVVDGLFAFWFLLGVARNIKRDPAEYELYSPSQFLVFAIFLNCLLVAFFNWHFQTDVGQIAFLLSFNSGIFMVLGLALLRNRERMRTIVHRRANGPIWLDVCWPAPLLFTGTAVVAVLILAGTLLAGTAGSPGLAFRVFGVFFAILWLVRDLQFLQWASLRKGKNALVMGVLYLIIFYVGIGIVFSALELFRSESVALTSFFMPSALYSLNPETWALRPTIWTAAFLAQFAIIGFLFHLQKQQLTDLASGATQPTPTAEPQASS